MIIKTICLFILAIYSCLSIAQQDLIEIDVNRLSVEPVLDGQGIDWNSKKYEIGLSQLKPDAKNTVSKVELQAGYFHDTVYFFLRWQDESKDLIHKPFVWSDEKGRYVKGPQREDRLAMQFRISGDYSTNWASGKEFVADMWHWKSSRSEPHGLAHDKSTHISRSKLLKSYKLDVGKGKHVYIYRPSDKGSKIYTSKRYIEKQSELMPKYVLPETVSGSVADVKTKALWKDGFWQLEVARKFDTGYDDDVVFSVGSSVVGGIAVFNHSENEDHNISPVLNYRFNR